MHYNIAKKTEVNPFENITHVYVSNLSCSANKLDEHLNKKSHTPDMKRVNGRWQIVFPVKYLDFTVLIKWFDADRGTFKFKGQTIHFSLKNEVITCW